MLKQIIPIIERKGLTQIKNFVRNNCFDILIISLAFPISIIVSNWNFLVFHSLVELFTATVGISVFLIAFNTKKFNTNKYLYFLGMSLFFVSLIDLLHLLSYRGMGVFNVTANVPTQLWIIGRYVQSISFLVALLLCDKILKLKKFYGVFMAYTIITSLLLFSVAGGYFPDCYIEGTGLTNFKIVNEYLIVAILTISFFYLYLQRHKFQLDQTTISYLMVSIFCTILSELAFTFYISVYSLSNVIGHIFRLYAFFLVYRAIIHRNLIEPYKLLFSDLSEKEQELEQEKRALKRANSLLEQFAHSIAHDIKAPLTNIKLGLHLLTQTELLHDPEEAQTVFEDLNSDVEDIKQFIDSIIHYSTHRGEKDVYSNPRKIIDEVITKFRSDQNFQVTTTNIPGRINCNKTQFSQICHNLLSNTIKYNDKATIKIDIRAKKLEHKDQYLFMVSDNGSGISKDIQTTIFQPFTKGNQDKHKEGTGSGFGLFLVKQLVEANNGEIWLESTLNEGNTFHFTLPA